MTDFLLLSLLTMTLIMGCSSAGELGRIGEEEQKKAIDIKKPTGKYVRQNVYVNNIQLKLYQDRQVLLITGNLPNGCTHLLEIGHTFNSEKRIELMMSAWQETGAMCTQQLVPFTYVYENISPKKLKKLETVYYKDQSFAI